MAEGRVEGQIMLPRGEGHGWNPLFQPTGSQQTFAEMTPEEHIKWNMRVKALVSLQDQLKQLR